MPLGPTDVSAGRLAGGRAGGPGINRWLQSKLTNLTNRWLQSKLTNLTEGRSGVDAGGSLLYCIPIRPTGPVVRPARLTGPESEASAAGRLRERQVRTRGPPAFLTGPGPGPAFRCFSFGPGPAFRVLTRTRRCANLARSTPLPYRSPCLPPLAPSMDRCTCTCAARKR